MHLTYACGNKPEVGDEIESVKDATLVPIGTRHIVEKVNQDCIGYGLRLVDSTMSPEDVGWLPDRFKLISRALFT